MHSICPFTNKVSNIAGLLLVCIVCPKDTLCLLHFLGTISQLCLLNSNFFQSNDHTLPLQCKSQLYGLLSVQLFFIFFLYTYVFNTFLTILHTFLFCTIFIFCLCTIILFEIIFHTLFCTFFCYCSFVFLKCLKFMFFSLYFNLIFYFSEVLFPKPDICNLLPEILWCMENLINCQTHFS